MTEEEIEDFETTNIVSEENLVENPELDIELNNQMQIEKLRFTCEVADYYDFIDCISETNRRNLAIDVEKGYFSNEALFFELTEIIQTCEGFEKVYPFDDLFTNTSYGLLFRYNQKNSQDIENP